MNLPRLPRFITLPLSIAALMWDASVILTSNYIEALEFYHGAMAEFLDLIKP